MKKRKPPIVLASFLILLVGAGLIFNASFQAKPEAPKPSAADLESAKNLQSRAPDSPTKTVTSLKNSFPQKRGDSTSRPGAEGPAPSVHVVKPSSVAPQNNDPNRTVGQWYAPESTKKIGR